MILQQLQQVNEETNQARFIKRIVTPTTPDVGDPASPLPSRMPMMNQQMLHFVQATLQQKSIHPIDPRDRNDEKIILELYSSFIQSLIYCSL